ncbi:MAG TPA: glycosyltransferase [Thermoplasmata archaeon]|nr:glycosyltransferase [Thermoplasmata archaeon]
MPADASGAPSAGASPREIPGTVSVIVTVLRDPRVARTLDSLLAQRRVPDEILVDDGGETDEVRRITETFRARDPRVRHLDAPGSISESRNIALRVASGELVAFLDADEVAPPGWLEELLRPFADPAVGFVGGPTPGEPASLRTIGARYYDGYLRRFYETVAPVHPQSLPMGNSAWRTRLFRDLGPLDTSLDRRAASEDQEFGVRALAAGWRGVYRREAWVFHDFGDLNVRALLRKQRLYAKGGFVVWRRTKSTYEATVGRVAPYAALPALLVVSLFLLLPEPTRLYGLWGALAGAAGLGILALLLTLRGWRDDRTYPGLRYSALEIPRRWATLIGAFQGLLRYGWSGRRNR